MGIPLNNLSPITSGGIEIYLMGGVGKLWTDQLVFAMFIKIVAINYLDFADRGEI